MELKVGDFVMTVDRLSIGRINNFCKCDMCKERGFYEPIIDNPDMFITNYDKEQKYHGYIISSNILNIIRAGDYVNGEKVSDVLDDGVLTEAITSAGIDGRIIYYDNISDIVTKEQFDNMRYKI